MLKAYEVYIKTHYLNKGPYRVSKYMSLVLCIYLYRKKSLLEHNLILNKKIALTYLPN